MTSHRTNSPLPFPRFDVLTRFVAPYDYSHDLRRRVATPPPTTVRSQADLWFGPPQSTIRHYSINTGLNSSHPSVSRNSHIHRRPQVTGRGRQRTVICFCSAIEVTTTGDDNAQQDTITAPHRVMGVRWDRPRLNTGTCDARSIAFVANPWSGLSISLIKF